MNDKLNKKKLIWGLTKVIVSVLCVSIFFLAILVAFDIVTFVDGFSFNLSIFNSFKNTWYGWCVMILFRTVVSIVFCFIPGISFSLGILITTLYENPWHAFCIWSIGVYVSSAIMYFVGKFGGYKVCEKLLGKEDCEKAFKILREKGTGYFPLTMMLPVFPDDALVMIAGVAKMNLPWFLGSVIIGRGVGVATTVFGIAIVPFESFTCLYDWLVFITGCVFWIIIFMYCAGKVNKVFDYYRAKQEAKLKQKQLDTANNNLNDGVISNNPETNTNDNTDSFDNTNNTNVVNTTNNTINSINTINPINTNNYNNNISKNTNHSSIVEVHSTPKVKKINGVFQLSLDNAIEEEINHNTSSSENNNNDNQ